MAPSRAGSMARPLLALVAVALASFLCFNHLSALAAVGYTYAWWLRPSISWVDGAPLDGAGGPRAAAAARDAALPVPRILHQTWRDRDVPERWRAAQQSCIDLHPGWRYVLWTDDDALRFLQEHYPDFVPTFESYPYAIQRADAIRYFVLHHHGGVYVDLDVGCRRPLDFLRRYDFAAPATHPVGVSNDVMAAAPRAPFLGRALRELPRWNLWLAVKYVQVMFSTGPMFLTVQQALAGAEGARLSAGAGAGAPANANASRPLISVIPAPVYGKYVAGADAAWYHLHGSSWHADDAAFFLAASSHPRASAAGVTAVLLGVVAAAAVAVRQRPRVTAAASAAASAMARATSLTLGLPPPEQAWQKKRKEKTEARRSADDDDDEAAALV